MKQPIPVLDKKYQKIVEQGDFYVSIIKDKKNTAQVIKVLTEKLPLKQFIYLKRVKHTGDNLQVLLCYKEDVSSDTKVLLEDVIGKDSIISEYLGRPILVKVPLNPPLTRQQLKEACFNWPCTFHEDKQISKLLSGKYFNEAELQNIKKHMIKAVVMAKISKLRNQQPIAVVIVDPSTDEVVAASYDLRKGDNPLQHAVMTCIDLVAKTQSGGMWNLQHEDLYFNNDLIKDRPAVTAGENKTGPYLCTGYDLYTTQEPCIMCAMALVHSRINQVFYGSSHTEGALGSFYMLHTQTGLNHHYQVFKNTLSTECDKLYDTP